MMNTENNAHPLELLLLAGLVVLEAAAVLLVAAVALLLTVARWRPAARPAPALETVDGNPGHALVESPLVAPESPDQGMPEPVEPASTAPAVHPLAGLAEPVAEALEPLTVAQLRQRARAAGLPRHLHHRGRRAALLTALAGLEVAAA
jgi:hypothetical protein